MNDESRLHGPGAPETTPRKPLPEDTGRTIGPGHLDMVFERIDQAVGISKLLSAAIDDERRLPVGALDATEGQQRLLEEAVEHLNEYEREKAESWRGQRLAGITAPMYAPSAR